MKIVVIIEICFSRFPKDEAIKNMWIEACGLNKSDNVKNLKICWQHFETKDFVDLKAKKYGGHLCLKNTAVPRSKKPIINLEHLDITVNSDTANVACKRKESLDEHEVSIVETNLYSAEANIEESIQMDEINVSENIQVQNTGQ